jgi:hypothetical protein
MEHRIYPLEVTFASINVGQQFILVKGGLAIKRTNRTADICYLNSQETCVL